MKLPADTPEPEQVDAGGADLTPAVAAALAEGADAFDLTTSARAIALVGSAAIGALPKLMAPCEARQSPMIVRTVPVLRRAVDNLRARKATVALVPTMGALHDGHVSLVRLAKRRATKVIVSIFVNPAQFSPTEDFGSYPRTWQADVAKLAAEKVDLIWHPDVKAMYPDGFATRMRSGPSPTAATGASVSAWRTSK